MLILKLTPDDGWNLGKRIAAHLIEVDEVGNVKRFLDLDRHGHILDASPTKSNRWGSTDHAPLDMACDWSDKIFPLAEFESLWRQIDK